MIKIMFNSKSHECLTNLFNIVFNISILPLDKFENNLISIEY